VYIAAVMATCELSAILQGPGDSCPTTSCGAAFMNMSDGGCCIGQTIRMGEEKKAWLDAHPDYESGNEDGLSLLTALPWLLKCVKPNVVPSCNASTIVVRARAGGKLHLMNIRFDYYVAHREDLEAKLKADIALTLGLSPDSIEILSVTEGSLVVTFSAVGTTEEQTTAIQSTLGAAITAGTFSFPTLTSALGSDGLDDSTLPITNDAALSGVAVDGGWSEYTTCNSYCGTAGFGFRNRTCNNPVPSNGGRTCEGASIAACDAAIDCTTVFSGAMFVHPTTLSFSIALLFLSLLSLLL